MKDDHMKNGQLKAAYNVQVSSNNQFVTNYTLHQSATDTTTYPTLLENYKQCHQTLPETAIANAGYGSEKNYEYLEQNNITAYVNIISLIENKKENIQSKKSINNR